MKIHYQEIYALMNFQNKQKKRRKQQDYLKQYWQSTFPIWRGKWTSCSFNLTHPQKISPKESFTGVLQREFQKQRGKIESSHSKKISMDFSEESSELRENELNENQKERKEKKKQKNCQPSIPYHQSCPSQM